MYVSTLHPAKTQNCSPKITDLSKMLMSTFTSKRHKMLLMSHYDETVINIGITTAKGSSTDTWINSLNVVRIKNN